MTFQKSLFSCTCFRNGFSVSQHGCSLPGQFPVAGTHSLQPVNFSGDTALPHYSGTYAKHILPQMSSHHLLQNRISAMEPPKGEWDSLVLGWTGWQKVLGQGVGIIARQLLATAVVRHHLILEHELPWDPWVGTPEFAGVTTEGCSCADSPAVTSLILVLHTWCDSLQPDSLLTSPWR